MITPKTTMTENTAAVLLSNGSYHCHPGLFVSMVGWAYQGPRFYHFKSHFQSFFFIFSGVRIVECFLSARKNKYSKTNNFSITFGISFIFWFNTFAFLAFAFFSFRFFSLRFFSFLLNHKIQEILRLNRIYCILFICRCYSYSCIKCGTCCLYSRTNRSC